MFQKRYNLIAIILIIIVSTGVYINTFKNEFVYDDIKLIVENPEIRNLSNISHLKLAERPMRTISLMLDYKLFKLNPAGYHLTNLILHILCSILVYFFIAGLKLRPTGKESKLPITNYQLPIFAALLFAVHPIQTEAVACISNRKEMLCMLFFMLSLILYIKSQAIRLKRTANLKNSIFSVFSVVYFCSIISFILALLSKQVAVTLPIVLILYDFSFPFLRDKRVERNRLWNIKSNAKFYSPFFIILIVAFFAFPKISAMYSPPGLEGVPHRFVFFTMARVFTRYMRLCLLPFNLCVDYSLTPSFSMLEGRVFVSLVILIASFIFAIKIFKFSKIIFFGFFWFLINLLPVSNILPQTHLIAERYLYLPSLGFCLILGYLIYYIAQKMQSRPVVIAYSLLLPILFTYSVLTIKRNSEWRSAYTLWFKTVSQSPNSIGAHINLGNAYRERKQYSKAISEYKKAFQIDSQSTDANFNIGNTYLEAGNYDAAILSFQKLLHIDPAYVKGYNNLGTAYTQKGLYDEAIYYYKEAIAREPNYAKAYYNISSVFLKKGMPDSVIPHSKQAIAINPEYFEALNNLGIAYGEKGLYNEAIYYFKKALNINPDFVPARRNLKVAISKKSEGE